MRRFAMQKIYSVADADYDALSLLFAPCCRGSVGDEAIEQCGKVESPE
jgi:hypothetical protein